MAQALQSASAATPVYPASHSQSAIDVLPSALELKAGHLFIHCSLPANSLKCPTAQRLHMPLINSNPALQTHCNALELAVANVVEGNKQCEHVSEPMLVLYFPTVHAVQGPPSSPV
jgi:hypothetical protein